MTALGFAVVGSFEDAMDGWRNHAQNFPEDNDGVILAATAGASLELPPPPPPPQPTKVAATTKVRVSLIFFILFFESV
jgi:hypothetical protein